MNLILIEPDKILSNNYCLELSKIGVINAFYDAQSSIEFMDSNIPDIIIIELQLAPVSGVSLLYELSSYEDFSKIPIVVYSSIPKEVFKLTEKDWQNLGVIKYFYKPKISIHKVASFVSGYFK